MSEVGVEDMVMFEAAMEDVGLDTKELCDRAIKGARKLPGLIKQLNS